MNTTRSFKTHHTFLSMIGFIAIAGASDASGYSFTTFDDPQGDRTEVRGVSGSTVIGSYYVNDDGSYHGFIYDGSAYKTVDFPAGSRDTYVTGISGGIAVGNSYYGVIGQDYGSHAFIYDGSTFTNLSVPNSLETSAQGISGDTIVGSYRDSANVRHGFIHTASTFTTLDFPGADATELLSISGGTIAGTYLLAGNPHPFTYDGSAFTALDFPGYPALHNPTITGISGHTVVGFHYPGSAIQFDGFIYDGSALTTLNFPGAWSTYLLGISGNTVFGTTFTGVPYGHGFIAEIPEPSSLCLLLPFGAATLMCRRRGAHR